MTVFLYFFLFQLDHLFTASSKTADGDEVASDVVS